MLYRAGVEVAKERCLEKKMNKLIDGFGVVLIGAAPVHAANFLRMIYQPDGVERAEPQLNRAPSRAPLLSTASRATLILNFII